MASDLLYLDGMSLAARPFGERRGRARGAARAVAVVPCRPGLRGRRDDGRGGARRARLPGPLRAAARRAPRARRQPATPGTACPWSRRRASCRRCWPSSAGCRCKRRRTDRRGVADATGALPREARLRADARAGARWRARHGAGASVSQRRTEAPGGCGRFVVHRHRAEPPPLRPAPRDRRRPRLVGRPEGADPRPRRAALRRPDRGPPDRVPRLRGRHPEGRVRRRRLDLLGLGHVRAGADLGSRARPSGRAS